ncbi:uncharacterized protein LOC144620340 [Crassostrea virginica]
MDFFSIAILRLCILLGVLAWGTTKGNKPPMTCESSRTTLEYVDQCPETKSEWDKAAAKKDCMSIRQNCSSSDQFVFHCLINPWENATVEVCALRVNIIGGKCTEYNALGAVVQEHVRLSCADFDVPCPDFYRSDEAYRYQKC